MYSQRDDGLSRHTLRNEDKMPNPLYQLGVGNCEVWCSGQNEAAIRWRGGDEGVTLLTYLPLGFYGQKGVVFLPIDCALDEFCMKVILRGSLVQVYRRFDSERVDARLRKRDVGRRE